MQQFRREDVLREKLNNHYNNGVVFTKIEDSGPNIYRAWLADDTSYTNPEELFGENRDDIQLGSEMHISLRSVGYGQDSIRYIEIEIIDTSSTESL